MTELLAIYQAWSERESLQFARRHADAAGDPERAADVQQIIDHDNETGPLPPTALEALAAQHELAERLAGWRWHTVRDARERGASWSEIASSIRSTPRETRIEYLGYVEGARQVAERYGTGFEAERYHRAAGEWTDELHPDTPPEAVEQIERAAALGDTETLDALQRVWWDPSRTPAVAQPLSSDPDPADGADEGTDEGEGGRAAPPDPWAPSTHDRTPHQDARPEWAWPIEGEGTQPVPRWDEQGVFEVYDPATGLERRDMSEEQYLQLAAERHGAGTNEPTGTDAHTEQAMERAAAVLDADRAAGTDWGHEDRALADHHADQGDLSGSAGRPSLIGRVPAPRTALGEVLDQAPAVELLARAERADNVTYTGDLAAKEWAYRELEAVGGEAARRAALTGAGTDRALSDYVELLCADPGVERFAEYTDLHRAVHQALGVDSVPPDTDTATDTAAGDGGPVAVAAPAGEHDRRPGETRDELAAARHEHDALLGRGEWGLSDHDRDRLVDALDPAGAAERDRLREAIDPATTDQRFAQLEGAALADRDPSPARDARPGREAWARLGELMAEPDPVADAAEAAARIERGEGPDSPAARAAWAEHGRRLDAAADASTDDPRWELGEDAARWSGTDAAQPDDSDSTDDGLVVGTIVLPGGLPPDEGRDDDPGPRLADQVWSDDRQSALALAGWHEFDHPSTGEAADGPGEREDAANPWWDTNAGRAHVDRARATNPSYDPTDKPSRPDDLAHLQQRLDRARAAVAGRDAARAEAAERGDADADAEDDPAARARHDDDRHDERGAVADVGHDDTAEGEDR